MNAKAQDYAQRPAREAVAVFDNESELLNTIQELESSGFDRSDMSVLPPLTNVEKYLGRKLASVTDVEDDPEVLRMAPVDRASFGAAQGILIGLPIYLGAVGAIWSGASNGADTSAIMISGLIGGVIGGVIGLALAALLRRRHARRIQEQIDRGGLLLWVRIRGEKQEERATTVITDHIVRHFHMRGELA